MRRRLTWVDVFSAVPLSGNQLAVIHDADGIPDEVQGAFALTATGRGFEANVAAGLDAGFAESSCVSCGACADTCPTDAITEVALVAQSREEAR